LLLDERIDLGIAPMTSHPRTIRYTTIRREVLRVAMSASRPAEAGTEVELWSLRDEQFEIWPRKMAPGFYDAMVGACRAAGFEPDSMNEPAATRCGGISHVDSASPWSMDPWRSSCQAGSGFWECRM
jgi:DNA-binding transcriptional LysR family regulator